MVGYLKAGSLPSLLSGLGIGGTLGLLGYGELNEWKKTGAVTRKWTLLSLLVVRACVRACVAGLWSPRAPWDRSIDWPT